MECCSALAAQSCARMCGSRSKLTCGVLQATRFPGLHFVLVMDRALEQLSCALAAVDALLRECADKIGTVLNALAHLMLVPPLFRAAEQVSGLTLHLGTEVVVIVADACSERRSRRARKRVARTVPEWAVLRAADAGPCLVIEMGPGRPRRRRG